MFPFSILPAILILLGGVFVLYAFHHRHSMLTAFDAHQPDPLFSIKQYLEPHLDRWDRSTTYRLVAGGILASLMIYLFIYHKDTRWAGAATGVFISLILGTILRNWLDFEDRILLHDIERAFRNQEGSD